MPDSWHDERFMAAAASYARRALGRVWPNPAVGALIVRDDGDGPVIVGRGYTRPPGGPHAEVVALAQAGEAARGATCYVTLEPCSHQGRTGPCCVALAEAGIRRVVIGLLDPNPRVAGRGVAMLEAAGVEVRSGVREELCSALHAGHVSRLTRGRPLVVLKLAVSRDGFIGRRGAGQVAITARMCFGGCISCGPNATASSSASARHSPTTPRSTVACPGCRTGLPCASFSIRMHGSRSTASWFRPRAKSALAACRRRCRS